MKPKKPREIQELEQNFGQNLQDLFLILSKIGSYKLQRETNKQTKQQTHPPKKKKKRE